MPRDAPAAPGPAAGLAWCPVSDIAGAAKRLVLGRPVRSDRLGHTLLPKRIALPVFASDALSSVGYAPDEILLTLSLAGLSATMISPWVGLAVVVVLITVVASYRQNVHAYPSGGGDYEVATTNLGKFAGLGVASALLVDYVLTVAVSISSGAQYAAAAIPSLRGHEAALAVALIALLMLVNLRGVRESGTAFAIPTYIFMFSIGTMAVVGFIRGVTGNLPMAESAGLDIASTPGFEQGLVGVAGGFLILRAFASGCAALTGVEAISNGVPMFRKPKSKNAATTLMLLGTISVAMLMSILALARVTHVRFVEEPAVHLLRNGVPVGESYVQDPTIGQIARSVFEGFSPAFYVVTAATGVILVLAANTAFNGFPVLGSILAQGTIGQGPAGKMVAFLEAKGLLEGYGSQIPQYGFNNPNPSVGSPNYGYEIWAVLPPEVEPEGDIRMVQFSGGLYAVTRFENLENIGRVWQELVKWREDSAYQAASHQWLEHLLNPLETDMTKYVFELYLPIKE